MLKISRALALTLMVSASLATTTHASSEREKFIEQSPATRIIVVTDQQAKQLAENQSKIPHVVAASQRGQDVSSVLLTPAEQAAKTYLTNRLAIVIANPSKDQINGAAAFIAGGDHNPTQAEVDDWVADNTNGGRAARVLVGAAGLDATDADLVTAAKRCVVVGINNPTGQQLQSADYLIALIEPKIPAPTRDQINGAAAFIAGGDYNPALPEIDGWVNNAGTRAERVIVGAAGLDATNADLIAAATCYVHVVVGIINTPNANQLNAARDLIAALAVNGLVDPTQNEINDVAGAGAGRAARIAAISAAGGAGRIA